MSRVTETPGYFQIHTWVTNNFGKATICEIDPTHTARKEWSNISGLYLRVREDWRQLCASCHRFIDQGDTCRKGHKYEGNTYVRKEGWRQCATCHKEAGKRYRKRKQLLCAN